VTDAPAEDPRQSTAERVARNDATFREANEKIEKTARRAGVESVPFICECAEPHCTEIVYLSLGEYERVRAEPTHFVNVPGHDASAMGYVRIVERHDGYVVVEKIGEAAEIVKQLDQRGGVPE
jgi:hypothetical protein